MTKQPRRTVVIRRSAGKIHHAIKPALEPRGTITVIADRPSEDVYSFFKFGGSATTTDRFLDTLFELAGDTPKKGSVARLGFADLGPDMADSELVKELRPPYRTELWVVAEILAHYEPGDQAALLTDLKNLFYVGKYTLSIEWSGTDRTFALDAVPTGVLQFRKGSRVFAPL
jgi:hypothetical protein